MSSKNVTVQPDKVTNIFIWDKEKRLRRKLWIHPDGHITYREWTHTGMQLYGDRERVLLPAHTKPKIRKKKVKKDGRKRRKSRGSSKSNR